MSRKDRFHDAVRHALEKEDWVITHDFIQTSLNRHAINLIAYNPIQETIQEWINFRNTDK